MIGKSRLALTLSRRSLPGLKCGTYLPDNATASPVFGLRPIRGGRKCSEKLPNPRISMRSPRASESLIKSNRCFTASSTSFAGRCFDSAVLRVREYSRPHLSFPVLNFFRASHGLARDSPFHSQKRTLNSMALSRPFGPGREGVGTSRGSGSNRGGGSTGRRRSRCGFAEG